MNLVQVIHQRWAAAAALNDVLPAARVYTGASADLSRPFALLARESHHTVAHYNNGASLDTVGLRFQVFHDHHDAAAAIVEQINAAFDHTQFALAGGDKVIHMRRSNDHELQEDDGAWRMTVEFACMVYVAPQA